MKIQDLSFGAKYTVEVCYDEQAVERGIYHDCQVELSDDYHVEFSLPDLDDELTYEEINDDDIIIVTQEDLDNGNIKIY